MRSLGSGVDLQCAVSLIACHSGMGLHLCLLYSRKLYKGLDYLLSFLKSLFNIAEVYLYDFSAYIFLVSKLRLNIRGVIL